MAPAVGIVITKQFAYRDSLSEQWSNKYWLSGAPPSDDTAWRLLFDDLVNKEKVCYYSSCHVVGGYAYNDNADGAQSVWSVDLAALDQEVPGGIVTSSGKPMAGDQAGMLQWQLARKNSRGKWVYLRKYFHAGFCDNANPDRLDTGTKNNYANFGAQLVNGQVLGGRYLVSQKGGESIQAVQASDWVTTRTLKRRGKRP